MKLTMFAITFLISSMAFSNEGIVRDFKPEKGYGFIKDSDSKRDYFFHISQVEKLKDEDQKIFSIGCRILFEVIPGREGRELAENIEILECPK